MSHADKVIEAIKAMTPEERVQSLISAGIIREDGTLMPRYGGTSTSGDIPTPETDAEQRQFGIGENRMYISADFARDLERRLAAATADAGAARKEAAIAREPRRAYQQVTEKIIAGLRSELAAATARAEEAWTKEVQTYYEKLEARYGRILYRLGIDPNNDPEKHVADLRAEVERLRKEREWQPIETAPKDGSYILATNPQSAGVWVAMYEEVFQSGYKPENPWRSMMLNHNHISTRHASTKPTHWMPLPDALAQTGEEKT